MRYPGGVLIAGDRRSTQGNMIAGRDVQKVYITDDFARPASPEPALLAVEFARLYAVELEHLKLEGLPMTFAGKGGLDLADVVPWQSRRGAAGLRRTSVAGGLRPR